jgi:hypothetical protein
MIIDSRMGDALDTILIALKLIGTLFSGVFGVLGLTTEFRNRRSKQITKWGRLSLLGIVISTIVAIASQSVETVRDKIAEKDAKDKLSQQLKLADTTLNEVERSVLPLTDLRIGYKVEIPIENPLLAGYRKRLTEGYELLQKGDAIGNAKFGSAVAGGPGFTDFLLGPSMRPAKEDGLIYDFLEQHGMSVTLYRQPIDISGLLSPPASGRLRADLSFSIEPQPVEVLYETPSGKLYFTVLDTVVDKTRWHGDDRIVSIPDLSGSQLVAQVLGPDMGSGPLDANTQSLLNGLRVESMTIRAGDRQINLSNFSYQGQYSSSVLPSLDTGQPAQ